MKAKDLKLLIKSEDISQRQMAKLLGIDERTMRRYCSGDAAIPRVVALAAEYIVDYMDEGEFEKLWSQVNQT